jgi:hypothetical protein
LPTLTIYLKLKRDIVAFANKYLGDNYAAIFKRKGEKSLLKISTNYPVETNADKQSQFVAGIDACK